MEFIAPAPTSKAPAEYFTGDVWWDVIYAGEEPSRMRANWVRFSPGARTAWHSHAVGQTLHIVSGIALIGTRDGTILEAHPGETVWTPPSEEHWHGAAPDRFMVHLAMWEGAGEGRLDADWLDKVTDAAYNGPRTRPQ
jgi:quercetin dioxygenase-like cupin family protein